MQNVGTIPQPVNQTQNNFESMNNNIPQPENISSKKEEIPVYQPLSEQKPTFASKPVPNFETTTNEVQQGQPNMAPLPVYPKSNIIQAPIQPINQQPTTMQSYNMPPQNAQLQNNNIGMNSNFMQNNNTIPQPFSLFQ